MIAKTNCSAYFHGLGDARSNIAVPGGICVDLEVHLVVVVALDGELEVGLRVLWAHAQRYSF